MLDLTSFTKVFFQKVYKPLIRQEILASPQPTFYLSLLEEGGSSNFGSLWYISDLAGLQGNIEWITKLLLKLEIPYNHSWGAFTDKSDGTLIEGGVHYYRPDRDDGEAQTTTIHDSMRVFDVERARSLLKNPTQLEKEIKHSWEEIQEPFPLKDLAVPDRLKPALAAAILRGD